MLQMLSKPSKQTKISDLRTEIVENGKTLRIYFPKNTFPILMQIYVELNKISGEGSENPTGTVWCFLQVNGTDVLFHTQNNIGDDEIDYIGASYYVYSDEPYIDLLLNAHYNFDSHNIEGVVTANFDGEIAMEV